MFFDIYYRIIFPVQYRSSTMNNSRQCLEFWYFMYGAHVGVLSVEKLSGVFSQLRWITSRWKRF